MTLQVFLYTSSQGDENHDNWIFSMTTLLSSTLIFNVLNAINEDSLEKLKYPFIFVTSSKFRQFRLNTNNDDMLQNIWAYGLFMIPLDLLKGFL